MRKWRGFWSHLPEGALQHDLDWETACSSDFSDRGRSTRSSWCRASLPPLPVVAVVVNCHSLAVPSLPLVKAVSAIWRAPWQHPTSCSS